MHGGPPNINLRTFQGGPPPVAYDLNALRTNLLRRMKIVSKARFTANKRLEAKAAATNFGLQVANLYTIAIGILLLQFPNAAAIQSHNASLNYISLVASVFVQIIALIETYKDYSGRARSMHDCAVAINRIWQDLELDPRLNHETLTEYHRRYSDAIKDSGVNHDDIDFIAAQIEPSRKRSRNLQEWLDLADWRLRYVWNVYSFTSFILALPWICYFFLRHYGLW